MKTGNVTAVTGPSSYIQHKSGDHLLQVLHYYRESMWVAEKRQQKLARMSTVFGRGEGWECAFTGLDGFIKG